MLLSTPAYEWPVGQQCLALLFHIKLNSTPAEVYLSCTWLDILSYANQHLENWVTDPSSAADTFVAHSVVRGIFWHEDNLQQLLGNVLGSYYVAPIPDTMAPGVRRLRELLLHQLAGQVDIESEVKHAIEAVKPLVEIYKDATLATNTCDTQPRAEFVVRAYKLSTLLPPIRSSLDRVIRSYLAAFFNMEHVVKHVDVSIRETEIRVLAHLDASLVQQHPNWSKEIEKRLQIRADNTVQLNNIQWVFKNLGQWRGADKRPLFANRVNVLFNGASYQFYDSTRPQCVYPSMKSPISVRSQTRRQGNSHSSEEKLDVPVSQQLNALADQTILLAQKITSSRSKQERASIEIQQQNLIKQYDLLKQNRDP